MSSTTIKEASEGRLMSCFGNNAGSAYTVFSLPAASDQEVPNPKFLPLGWQYKLRQDEAIVLITPLPPECKYYSFINYIMFTEQKEGKDYSNEKSFFTVGDETTGIYHPIFGSIGEPVNLLNIKHDGDSVYDSNAVIVISANRTVEENVIAQLQGAGYDSSMINSMPIPAEYLSAGSGKGRRHLLFPRPYFPGQRAAATLTKQTYSNLAETSIVVPSDSQRGSGSGSF